MEFCEKKIRYSPEQQIFGQTTNIRSNNKYSAKQQIFGQKPNIRPNNKYSAKQQISGQTTNIREAIFPFHKKP